jgi:hypothetical protein
MSEFDLEVVETQAKSWRMCAQFPEVAIGEVCAGAQWPTLHILKDHLDNVPVCECPNGDACGEFSYQGTRGPTIMTANLGCFDCSAQIASIGILYDRQEHFALPYH